MIYLINLPNWPGISPNLALSQFKAMLTERGMPCKVLEMQLVMASLLTPGEYHQLWSNGDWRTMLSDLAWVPFAWGGEHDISANNLYRIYKDETTGETFSGQQLQWLEWYKSNIPKLFTSCTHLLQTYGAPKVVGFSCNRAQLLPALATGRMIKTYFPRTKLVYGGPSFFGEMGTELIYKVESIDAVATGESDEVVVDLMSALSNGDTPSGLRGILYRKKDGGIGHGPSAQPISERSLENIPEPDYEDFFELAHQLGLPNNEFWNQNLTLYFEGTRGCWWAQKNQCKFCGRDNQLSPLRTKSSDRVYELIDSLHQKYPNTVFRAADEAICIKHLESLVPKLNDYAKQPFLYYALRIDRIDRAAMQKLKASCIYGGLVGIECLSTRLLKLMCKGTTQLQNVYFLKLCRQYNFNVTWNMLCRIPGECREDYEQIERLIPKIRHLPPPDNGMMPIQLYRFSRYFKKRSEITEMKLTELDRLMYPGSRIDPYKVIYIFSATWKNTLQESEYQDVFKAIAIWHGLWQQPRSQHPQLLIHKHPGYDGIEIFDTRTPGRNKTYTLDREQAKIYELAADPCKFETIMENLHASGEGGADAHRAQIILDGFISSGLMIREKRRYLSLAIPDKINSP